jgi:nucleoside-diphosphate-sugar epimerase
LTGEEFRPDPVLPTDRIEFEFGPYESEFAAYAASKVAALAEAECWMARTHPDFDLIHLHPSFVEGRNDLATTPREAMKGTNGLVLGLAFGKNFENPIAGATVHNEDVARAHIQALDSSVPGNSSYILSQSTEWNDAIDIIRRKFPNASLPNTGSAVTHELPIDVSATEDVFGFQHLGFSEQVKSVVGHYLELRSKGRKSVRKNSVVEASRIVSMSMKASA